MWVRDIHRYWFGDADVYEDAYEHRFKLWYRGGPKVDAEIAGCFGQLLSDVQEAYASGCLAEYQRSPRACCALVVLLDQMSRNIWRGDARMFEADSLARGIVEDLLGSRQYDGLALVERLFLCVALEHAEDVAVVERSAALMAALSEQAPAPQQKRFLDMCRFNKQHLDTVRSFGRYPHRNKLLQRDDTPEEADFLSGASLSWMRSVSRGQKEGRGNSPCATEELACSILFFSLCARHGFVNRYL